MITTRLFLTKSYFLFFCLIFANISLGSFFQNPGLEIVRSLVGAGQNTAYKKQQEVECYFGLLAENIIVNPVSLETRALARDLHFFVGSPDHPERSLLNSLDRTKTVFGYGALAEILAHPLSYKEQLEQRQNAICSFHVYPHIFDDVRHCLDTVAQAQGAFLSYGVEVEENVFAPYKKLYFQNKYLQKINHCEHILAARSFAQQGLRITALLMPVVLLTGLHMVKNYKDSGSVQWSHSCLDAIKQCGNFINPKQLVIQCKEIYSGQRYTLYQELCKEMQVAPLTRKTQDAIAYGFLGIQAAIKGYLIGSYAWSMKRFISDFINLNKSLRSLQEDLHQVASIVQVYNELQKMISCIPELEQEVGCATLSEDAEFVQLLELLQTNTFLQEYSIFSHAGRILAAHNLLLKHKEKFIPIVRYIGQIDALISIETLYQEAQQTFTAASYCFAQYTESSIPSVQLDSFWNPFIDRASVITNTIHMGGADPRVVILTGSNTGGKSTALKAIMLNLMLAHTLTIAPSYKCIITPFSHISCSFNIVDDLVAGDSHFKAEAKRAQLLQSIIDQASEKHFTFIGVDELFIGTGVEQGMVAAHTFLNKMENNPYVLCPFITHLSGISDITHSNPTVFVNMCMDAYISTNGSLVCPYKLQPGVSHYNSAQDILGALNFS